MQRYFLPAGARQGELARIEGADFHHINRVMRMQVGAAVEVVCAGQVWLARVEDFDLQERYVRVKLEERSLATGEASVAVTLLQGLPKGDKADLIVRQAAEIGTSRVVFFRGERSVAEVPDERLESRLSRWGKIAKESCELAHRTVIPVVDYASSLADGLRRLGLPDRSHLLLVPYEMQATALPTLREILRGSQSVSDGIVVVIGPEGGFADREIELLVRCEGQLLTLGPRILRTETAGLVVAACVLYERDELRVREHDAAHTRKDGDDRVDC